MYCDTLDDIQIPKPSPRHRVAREHGDLTRSWPTGSPTCRASCGRRLGIDGDSDLDIVACVFVSSTIEKTMYSALLSLVWLERTGRSTFVKHTFSGARSPRDAPLGDVDDDGDLDILVGSFLVEAEDAPMAGAVWENKRKAPGGGRSARIQARAIAGYSAGGSRATP